MLQKNYTICGLKFEDFETPNSPSRDLGCFDYFCRVCWEQHHAQTFPQAKVDHHQYFLSFFIIVKRFYRTEKSLNKVTELESTGTYERCSTKNVRFDPGAFL